MSIDTHFCRFYLDIKGKLKPKAIEQVCEIVLTTIQKASPVLSEKIFEVQARTEKQHRYDTEKGKKLKSGHKYKSFFVNLEVEATARKTDLLLEKTIPLLKANLIAAGFKVNQGWAERIKPTKADMEN